MKTSEAPPSPCSWAIRPLSLKNWTISAHRAERSRPPAALHSSTARPSDPARAPPRIAGSFRCIPSMMSRNVISVLLRHLLKKCRQGGHHLVPLFPSFFPLACLEPRPRTGVPGIVPQDLVDDPPCLLLLPLVPVNARHRDRPDRCSSIRRGSPPGGGRRPGARDTGRGTPFLADIVRPVGGSKFESPLLQDDDVLQQGGRALPDFGKNLLHLPLDVPCDALGPGGGRVLVQRLLDRLPRPGEIPCAAVRLRERNHRLRVPRVRHHPSFERGDRRPVAGRVGKGGADLLFFPGAPLLAHGRPCPVTSGRWRSDTPLFLSIPTAAAIDESGTSGSSRENPIARRRSITCPSSAGGATPCLRENTASHARPIATASPWRSRP